MNTRLAGVLLAGALVLSSGAMTACERQDIKEAEKVGDDIRKGFDELEDRADRDDRVYSQ